jgi:hypothetical protein
MIRKRNKNRGKGNRKNAGNVGMEGERGGVYKKGRQRNDVKGMENIGKGKLDDISSNPIGQMTKRKGRSRMA